MLFGLLRLLLGLGLLCWCGLLLRWLRGRLFLGRLLFRLFPGLFFRFGLRLLLYGYIFLRVVPLVQEILELDFQIIAEYRDVARQLVLVVDRRQHLAVLLQLVTAAFAPLGKLLESVVPFHGLTIPFLEIKMLFTVRAYRLWLFLPTVYLPHDGEDVVFCLLPCFFHFLVFRRLLFGRCGLRGLFPCRLGGGNRHFQDAGRGLFLLHVLDGRRCCAEHLGYRFRLVVTA